jgi:excisionase family DNA binding protein
LPILSRIFVKNDSPTDAETYTTLEAARLMGMAVRSVQLMVDRGELQAWKTGGGHRRIARQAVHAWVDARHMVPAQGAPEPGQDIPAAPVQTTAGRPVVLLIEDSVHYQNLLRLLIGQRFPGVDLHVAPDGITGLILAGELQPEILIVDILLPGIDGATLITGLRSHPQFARSQLIVVTGLDAEQRAPYAFALEDVPVVHKPQVVTALPPLLAQALKRLEATV